jgi:hypothetical protein
MNHVMLLISFIACTTEKENTSFSIISNPDTNKSGFAEFDRKIEIFGLGVYAEEGVQDEQLLYAANIMAELLDNNEDGTVDDEAVLAELQESEAFMPIFSEEGSIAENNLFDNYNGSGAGAVLYAQEVDPNNPGRWGYDASVEETMHTINSIGHVVVYPDAFGLQPNSSLLSNAMDLARGGQFEDIPQEYPEESWYHYDDETCDYECMAIEYIYWAQVSWMGLLNEEAICSGISNEWEVCTPESLQEVDIAVHAIITSSEYGLPQIAPDGNYSPPE